MSVPNPPDPRAPQPTLHLVDSDGPPNGAARPLRITVRRGQGADGVALVVVAGAVDPGGAARLRTAISELVSCRYVVVDLDDATCTDAGMLPRLIDATCAEVDSDVSLLFTDDPRSLMMLRIAGPLL